MNELQTCTAKYIIYNKNRTNLKKNTVDEYVLMKHKPYMYKQVVRCYPAMVLLIFRQASTLKKRMPQKYDNMVYLLSFILVFS